MAPSVTPKKQNVGSNNPGLRLYKFETDTGQVSGSASKRKKGNCILFIILVLTRVHEQERLEIGWKQFRGSPTSTRVESRGCGISWEIPTKEQTYLPNGTANRTIWD